MRFSQLLQQISGGMTVQVLHTADLHEISDVALIDGVQDRYRPDTLYFGYAEQLSKGRLPPQCVLARNARSERLTGAAGDLALTAPESLFALFNAARQRLESTRGFYGELMAAAASASSIDPIINLAAARLGNSVVLLDADFKILGHSTLFPIEDPLWEENIRLGYCSYEFVSAVAELDAVKNAAPNSDPVVVTCYASPLRKLSSKIYIGGKRVGIVLMLEKESPISSLHMELLPIISAAAGDAIARYAPFLISGNTDRQKLLYDLLIGASPEEVSSRISGLAFSGNLCALCIRQSRYLGQRHLKEDVVPQLLRGLPEACCAFHEGGIAVLVPLHRELELSQEQLEGLHLLAQSEHLRIGISGLFFQPESFARHYAQARRALELSARLHTDEAVIAYPDYAFYDLLNKTSQGEDLGVCCHPALSILNRYDHANGTDLYRTLETYLLCGGSVKDTAQRLFIHRNSLNYRLERIRELTHADPADTATRFHLEMSYRIDRFIGHNG